MVVQNASNSFSCSIWSSEEPLGWDLSHRGCTCYCSALDWHVPGARIPGSRSNWCSYAATGCCPHPRCAALRFSGFCLLMAFQWLSNGSKLSSREGRRKARELGILSLIIPSRRWRRLFFVATSCCVWWEIDSTGFKRPFSNPSSFDLPLVRKTLHYFSQHIAVVSYAEGET
jgi:hypothetical protein